MLTQMKRFGALALALALVFTLAPSPARAADGNVAVSLRRADSIGDPVNPGDILTFEAVINNVSGGDITDFTANIPLPAALTYIPGSLKQDNASMTDAADGDGASFSGGAASASWAAIPDGGAALFTLQAKVSETAAGAYTVSAAFAYEAGTPKSAAASLNLYVVNDGITLSVNVSPVSFQPGASGVITIGAKNNASVDVSDITVTLNLPAIFSMAQAALTVGSGSSKSISWQKSGDIHSFSVGTVPAGKSAVITASVLTNVLAPAGLYSCKAAVKYGAYAGDDTASANMIVMPAAVTPTPTPVPTPTPSNPPKKDISTVPDKFSDDDGHWAEVFINILADEGVMKGTGEGLFEPEAGLTRAMIVQTLYNVYGKGEIAANGPFTDLKQDWYVNAVNWAAKNNIVSGVSETEFAPDAPATREQAVVILDRMLTLLKKTVTPTEPEVRFADHDAISEYARSAVYRFQSYGIVSGGDIGKFYPATQIKRAEFAKIMCLFLDATGELGYDVSRLK